MGNAIMLDDEMRLINETTTTEDLKDIGFTTDKNGNSFTISKFCMEVETPSDTTGASAVVYLNNTKMANIGQFASRNHTNHCMMFFGEFFAGHAVIKGSYMSSWGSNANAWQCTARKVAYEYLQNLSICMNTSDGRFPAGTVVRLFGR